MGGAVQCCTPRRQGAAYVPTVPEGSHAGVPRYWTRLIVRVLVGLDLALEALSDVPEMRSDETGTTPLQGGLLFVETGAYQVVRREPLSTGLP